MKVYELSSYDSPEILAPLIANFGFNPIPPTDRETRTWVVATLADKYLGTAIVRMDEENRWHLWYAGVLPAYQRQGAGSKLLSVIENAARDAGAIALRTRTYSRWTEMRYLLTKRGWAFVNAALGDHHDGVEEEWLLPLRRDPLRVVLVGANRDGRGGELYKAISELPSLVQLVGVCDADPLVLKTWHDVPSATNISDLLAIVTAEAAVLALPHAAYKRVRTICLDHSLGLLHEKPLACSLGELLELQDRITASPIPLVVGVQRRSHPSYVYLKQALQDDRPHTLIVRISLGRSASDVTSNGQPSGKWRDSLNLAGGGALIDIGYHAIDLVHYLLDSPFVTIACNLWVGDKPAMGGQMETAATLVGRCGNTWVRLVVDRAGQKFESVFAVGKTTWEANRKEVSCDGQLQFSCGDSWDLALRGRIVDFVLACSAVAKPVNLWDHLAELRVIEQARTLAHAQGLGNVGVDSWTT